MIRLKATTVAAGMLFAGLLVPSIASAQTVRGDVTASQLVPPSTVLSSDMHSLVEDLRTRDRGERMDLLKSVPEERVSPPFRLMGDDLEMLESYIFLKDWTPSAKQQLSKLGAKITGEDESRWLVQAWLPIDQIDPISELAEVRSIRRPNYAFPSEGFILSSGDTALGTNWVRTLGEIDGNGLRVGVLSVGLFNQSFPSSTVSDQGANADVRVISGDLPAYPPDVNDRGEALPEGPTSGYLGGVRIFPQSPTLHQIDADPESLLLPNNAEGGAILETIHDVAPGAGLFFAHAATDVDLSRGRQFLFSQGVDVIVDDTAFVGAGRFDGTSPLAREAQDLVLDNDIIYVMSAGNFTAGQENVSTSPVANRFPLYVNGYFSPDPGVDGNKFHNFASGRNVSVRDEGLSIFPTAGAVDVILVWDDVWDDQNPRATDDLDLFLVNSETLDISSPIASSVNLQNGTGVPMERIQVPLFGSASVVIRRKDASDNSPKLFTLLILQGGVSSADSAYLTHGVPLNNADAMPPVITVGGMDAAVSLQRVLPTTVPGVSPGPGRERTNSFVTWFLGQTVPAVISFTNTENRTTGILGGSSGATAHVGGLVTLLSHEFRQIPAWDWYDVLRDTTTDSERLIPNASPIEVDRTGSLENGPDYRRVNGFDTYVNLGLSDISAIQLGSSRTSYLSTTARDIGWTSSGPEVGFKAPVFNQSSAGLEISAGGQQDVFGFWESPLFTFQDERDGEERKSLRTDCTYELTVRVGCDESDPLMVPPFRLRLTSGVHDETAALVVSGVNRDVSAPPTSVSGKNYKLYYTPENAKVAEQGVRFAFDLLNFDESDNADATFYIHSVSLREIAPKPVLAEE